MDKRKEFMDGIKALLTKEDLATASGKMLEKDQLRRFGVSLLILDQMLREGPKLIEGDIEGRVKEWNLCVESVLDLWKASACLWRNGHFAAANALAISTLEETGKIAVERFRLLGVEKIDIDDKYRTKLNEEWKLRKKPFVDHLTKSVLAAMSGALFNSRLDRILGMEFVSHFLYLAEENNLERTRQDCLYLDRRDGFLIRPQDLVTPDQSARFVALAGEILAEVLPDPVAWEEVLELVKEFEKYSGLPFE